MGLYLLIFIAAVIFIDRSRTLCKSNNKWAVCLIAVTLLVSITAGTGCAEQASTDRLLVHFIDVGQGDSILIENGSHTMLIDAGDKHDSVRIRKYLEQQGISQLDYVVGTHALDDHIGGMDAVIKNFEIGRIFLPEGNLNTETYRAIRMSLLEKYIDPTRVESGKTYALGDASFMFLAPNNSRYDDVPDYSIVIKVIFGNNSFLFTGDAGQISEQEMIDMCYDLSADVLKLGRHGSSSSSSDEFINAVGPIAAVISVGKDNEFGYPHMDTMLKLQEKGIDVYRTDEQGTIIAASDGNEITFNVEPGSYTWPEIIDL